MAIVLGTALGSTTTRHCAMVVVTAGLALSVCLRMCARACRAALGSTVPACPHPLPPLPWDTGEGEYVPRRWRAPRTPPPEELGTRQPPGWLNRRAVAASGSTTGTGRGSGWLNRSASLAPAPPRATLYRESSVVSRQSSVVWLSVRFSFGGSRRASCGLRSCGGEWGRA
jgi:hypothetical protein